MKPKARPSGLIATLIVAGVIILALCCGGAAGAIVGAATEEGPTGPSAPPALPEAFPRVDQRYLPGVRVDTFESWLTVDNDFDCEHDPPDFVNRVSTKHLLWCRGPGSYAHLDIEFDELDQVAEIKANCNLGPGADEEYCRTYIGLVLETTFVEAPELQGEARAWGEENADNNAQTVIGGMSISTRLDRRAVRVVPAA